MDERSDGEHNGAAASHLRILVYNVSHSDVLYGYSLRPRAGGSRPGEEAPAAPSGGPVEDDPWEDLCRATFSQFFPVSNQVLQHVLKPTTGVSIVLGSRADGAGSSPVGFRLEPPLRTTLSVDAFRFRHPAKIQSVLGDSHTNADLTVVISTVYFPLIAIVAPAWFPHRGPAAPPPHPPSDASLPKARLLKGSNVPALPILSSSSASPTSSSQNLRLLMYLISGNGMPRNSNHNPLDNSTSAASYLIAEFVRSAYTGCNNSVHTQVVNSNGDLFRCHHNVTFVNKQLRPLIDAHRRRLAKTYGETWQRRMHVTLALTDGAPARMQALQACLRNYRPVFLHVWQLKSFWHDRTLTIEDLDIQTFEDMETRPPVDRHALPEWQQRLVNEMAAFKREFDQTRQEDKHELHGFWLRKTKKPVLSVVMVEVEDEGAGRQADGEKKDKTTQVKFYRGINCEVSMPTGSLCSERNAIGTALAATVGIRREHFKAVAIMSTSKVREPGKHEAVSPRRTPAFSRSHPPHSPESARAVASSASSSPTLSQKRARPHAEDSLDAWRLKRWRSNSVDSTAGIARGTFLAGNSGSYVSSGGSSISGVHGDADSTINAVSTSTDRIRSGTPHSPRSRRAMMGPRLEIQTDLNPIAPCGACLEWLKKIAEVNPDFRVLMFEDTSCAKVFVRSVFGVGTR